MHFEEVGLWVEEAADFDCLVGVEGVLFSEFGCGELVSVVFDPVVEGGEGYLCLVFTSHCPCRLVRGVARVVAGEGREDELWRVGCVRECAVCESF